VEAEENFVVSHPVHTASTSIVNMTTLFPGRFKNALFIPFADLFG
jgi:hypothetical protein